METPQIATVNTHVLSFLISSYVYVGKQKSQLFSKSELNYLLTAKHSYILSLKCH